MHSPMSIMRNRINAFLTDYSEIADGRCASKVSYDSQGSCASSRYNPSEIDEGDFKAPGGNDESGLQDA